MNTNLDKSTMNAVRERGKESLFFFARAILGFDDLDKDIHRPICRVLQDYEKNTRIKIILPRDWFKSSIGSVAYPIWRAVNNPNVRCLVAQNTYSNACRKLFAIKQIFETNKLFRALYPEILPDGSRTWTKECLTVNRTGAYPEGTFEAAGTGTAVTSRHYDVVIEDDTVSPERDALTGLMQQPTQLEIEKAIGWHRLVHPLLLHPSKSQIVVIGTRWCQRDLLGWLDIHGKGYVTISRAARENGKPVWSRYNNKVLEQLESELGPYMFASLFLNDPSDVISQVFKREWIHYYHDLQKNLVFCTSVDPAPSDTDSTSDPDYNVVLTTGIKPSTGDVYVVDITRERMNPGQLIDCIFWHYSRYKPVVVKVEAIAYQRTISYYLQRRQRKLKMPFYIEEIKSLKGSKADRIRGLQPFFAANQVFIKTSMSELERELLSFPRGAHDDIIDALSMQRDFWNEEMATQDDSKNELLLNNPMSAASVLNELLERTTIMNRYPADIGLMGERIEGNQVRDFSYV